MAKGKTLKWVRGYSAAMSQLRYKQHAAAVPDDVFSKTRQLPIGNLGQLGFEQQGSGLICCLIFSPLVLSVLLRDVTWHRTVTVTWRLLWHGEGSQSILNYLLSGFHFIGYDLLEICWTLAEGINYVYWPATLTVTILNFGLIPTIKSSGFDAFRRIVFS